MLQILLLVLLSVGKQASCQTSVDLLGDPPLFHVKFANTGNYTDFLIRTPLGHSVSLLNSWVAIGFNTEPKMDNSDVVMCINSDRVKTVENRYNERGFRNIPVDSAHRQIGLSLSTVQITQNHLVCSFRRLNDNQTAKMSNLSDPSRKLYLIAAYGSVDRYGNILKHISRGASAKAFNFAKVVQFNDSSNGSFPLTSTRPNNAVNITNTTQPLLNSEGIHTEGPLTLEWKSDTHESFTEFAFTVDIRGKQVLDILSSQFNYYMAMAFSYDQLMGGDHVVCCQIYNNNSFRVVQMYNQLYEEPILLDKNNPSFGISEQAVQFNDGSITCSFRREKYLGRNISIYFDIITQDFYILMAFGQLQNETMLYHTMRSSSASKIDFEYFDTDLIPKVRPSSFVIAHSSFMAMAWMFLVPFSLLSQRFYGTAFPVSRLAGSESFWSKVHRGGMIVSSCCCLAGFLCILAENSWAWTDMYPVEPFAHSIIGILTLGFFFIQFILGIVRSVLKDSKLTTKLSATHRTLGVFTFILSFAALWLGVVTTKSDLMSAGWVIMIFFTVWVVVILIILIVLEVFFVRTRNEYHENAKRPDEHNTERLSIKKKMRLIQDLRRRALVMNFLVLLAFAVALIIAIAII